VFRYKQSYTNSKLTNKVLQRITAPYKLFLHRCPVGYAFSQIGCTLFVGSNMVNLASSQSGYFQSTCFGNLPRLLQSFTQAEIPYTVLTGHTARPADAVAETVELALCPVGYAKFQQVFLGQRCVRLPECGEHTFWDSRTGLTIHLTIAAQTADAPHPKHRQTRYPSNRRLGETA
jgi:hypothetical protein